MGLQEWFLVLDVAAYACYLAGEKPEHIACRLCEWLTRETLRPGTSKSGSPVVDDQDSEPVRSHDESTRGSQSRCSAWAIDTRVAIASRQGPHLT